MQTRIASLVLILFTASVEAASLAKNYAEDERLPVADFPGSGVRGSVYGGGVFITTRQPDSPNSENLFASRPQDTRGPVGRAVWIPGAKALHIKDLAVSQAGVICVTGTATSADGRSGSFLWILDNLTAAPTIVRLYPFTDQAVGFGPDGTIWVLVSVDGLAPPADRPGDYEVLWQFSASGAPLRKVVRLSSLGLPARDNAVYSRFRFLPYVGASRDSVFLFVPQREELLEFSQNGEPRARIEMPSFRGASDYQLAFMKVSPDGVVAASLSDRADKFMSAYVLNSSASVWLPIRKAGGGPTRGEYVLGFDGERIVTGSDTERSVYWHAPQPTE